MSTLEIQQALKAAGFDPGALDGKDGAHTRAAVKAYQQAHGLTPDGIAGPKTQAALRGAAPSATASAGGADAATQQAYPQYSWLYSDPELGPLLREATAGGWSIDRLEGAMQQTTWWKTHSADARNFLQLAATDPKTTVQRLNDYDSIQKYMTAATSFGLPMSFGTATQQVARVVRGDITADELTQELRNLSKAMYPQLTQQIDGGATVADVFEPYKQLAVSTLGLNPADVNLADPKWNSLLQMSDQAGGRRLPTQDEVATRLRTDPSFGYTSTQSGRDSGFGLVNAISNGFGMDQAQ